MFFRDASFGTCLYNLNILDCLRAVHKVGHFRLVELNFSRLFTAMVITKRILRNAAPGPAVRLARLLEL